MEPDAPITVIVTRQVRPDAVAAFEAAVRDWIPKATSFPGHLGVLMLRPPPGSNEFGAVLKFRTAADWKAFQQWPDYVAWLDSLRPLLLDDSKVHEMHGLDAWFPTPGNQPPPPRWKMALVTWVGVNVVVGLLSQTLQPLLGSWGWPFLLNMVTVNAGVVAGLTWVVMPFLMGVARPWLFRKGAK